MCESILPFPDPRRGKDLGVTAVEGNCPSVDLAGGGITDGQSLVVAMQRKAGSVPGPIWMGT